MSRAQFRDQVMLRWANGALGVPSAASAPTAALYDVGTSNPISEPIYADESSATLLPNPIVLGTDGLIDFWLVAERELDVVVSALGYTSMRNTVMTDAVQASIVTGLPPAGTTGQALVKQSNTDYDAVWGTPTWG